MSLFVSESMERPPAVRSTRWSARALFTVGFLGVTAGVQMSDRGLQAVLLAAIQATFHVSDTTIGALQGLAGVLVGSGLAIPMGRAADRFSRKMVLLWLIVGWGALMALSALAPNFPLFFLGRAASGVTEFAMIPVVYSMIPELAPERSRVPANLSFAALMAAGASAGFYYGEPLAGFANRHLAMTAAPWRKAMLLLAWSSVALLVAGLFTLDPPRQGRTADDPEREPGASVTRFLRSRWQAVGLFLGVAGSLLIAVQALNPLIALALGRRFGTGAPTIGRFLGIATLVTSLGCLPVAGLIDRVLQPRFGLRYRPAVMGVGAVLAIPCAASLLTATSVRAALLRVGLFLFFTSTANALVPTMLQDLTPASIRASSFSIWSFAVSVCCSIGPLVAGGLSDSLLHGNLLAAIALTAVPALCLSALCAARTALRRDVG